jgi:exodeoxyribonuclease VII large subunit
LFSAVLNGDGAIESIQKQLLLISKYTSFFDAVVIVRGGGGEIGMTCYNNYQLCETIANFPLPILTGIGHSTNMTVAEMIAYKSTITPTELAGFFVERFRKFELSVLDTLNKIIAETRYLLVQTKKELVSESRVFRNVSFASLINNKQKSEQVNIDLKRTSLEALKKENLFLIDEVKQFKNTLNWIHKAEISKLENTTRQVDSTSKRLLFNKNAMLLDLRVYLNNKIPRVLDENKTQLTKYESMIKLVHPDTILKKGYTISLVNGRAISEANPVQIGDEIKTITAFTEFLSRVEIVKKT